MPDTVGRTWSQSSGIVSAKRVGNTTVYHIDEVNYMPHEMWLNIVKEFGKPVPKDYKIKGTQINLLVYL